MARRCPCDACGAPRERWQRICRQCWSRLPGDIRSGIIDAFRQRRQADWRDWKKRAAAFLASGAPARPSRSATPEHAYRLAAAITGDREP